MPTMTPLEQLQADGHEQVTICNDSHTGLHAIIAIHSTKRGPALGGVRMWPYLSIEDALRDALRLSRAMTFKAAVSRVPFGGGKAVIMADPTREKRPALLTAFGRLLNSLGGRYITAQDVGMTVEDMECIRRATPYVTGTGVRRGGSGDPSEMTAIGVLHGIRAVVEELTGGSGGTASLRGVRVAIQGLGKVGYRLASLLHQEGADLIVTDLRQELTDRAGQEFGAKQVGEKEIFDTPCDLLAPCALGGTLNHMTIPRLRCRAVAGCANNQLAEPEDGDRLHERGILYAPDFVINAGGLINIAVGFGRGGYNVARAERRTRTIFGSVKEVFRIARTRGCSTAEAAERLGEERLQSGPRRRMVRDRSGRGRRA
jgi:leucine dehydrogenase